MKAQIAISPAQNPETLSSKNASATAATVKLPHMAARFSKTFFPISSPIRQLFPPLHDKGRSLHTCSAHARATGQPSTLCVFVRGTQGGSRTAPTEKRKPVGRLIGVFKTVTTKRFNETRCSPGEGRGGPACPPCRAHHHTKGEHVGSPLHRVRGLAIFGKDSAYLP